MFAGCEVRHRRRAAGGWRGEHWVLRFGSEVVMKQRRLITIIAVALMGLPLSLSAQRTGAAGKLNEQPDWYKSDDAKKMAANVLSYQSDLGGWPSNTDTAAKPYDGDRSKLGSTFDNSSTTDELRFLARMFVANKEERYQKAFDKG